MPNSYRKECYKSTIKWKLIKLDNKLSYLLEKIWKYSNLFYLCIYLTNHNGDLIPQHIYCKLNNEQFYFEKIICILNKNKNV